MGPRHMLSLLLIWDQGCALRTAQATEDSVMSHRTEQSQAFSFRSKQPASVGKRKALTACDSSISNQNPTHYLLGAASNACLNWLRELSDLLFTDEAIETRTSDTGLLEEFPLLFPRECVRFFML